MGKAAEGNPEESPELQFLCPSDVFKYVLETPSMTQVPNCIDYNTSSEKKKQLACKLKTCCMGNNLYFIVSRPLPLREINVYLGADQLKVTRCQE